MIYLFSVAIRSFDTHKKHERTANHRTIVRDCPIEMHDRIIGFINRNVIRDITTKFSIRALVVDINDHRRHIMTIPISRTIERNSLDVMIILNGNPFKLAWNSNATIASDHNMWFRGRLSS